MKKGIKRGKVFLEDAIAHLKDEIDADKRDLDGLTHVLNGKPAQLGKSIELQSLIDQKEKKLLRLYRELKNVLENERLTQEAEDERAKTLDDDREHEQ